MGRAGRFRVRRRAGETAQFHFGGNIIASNHEDDELRIRADLEEASAQLKRVAEPGLVVLDACCDSFLRNQVAMIADVLETEPWTETLLAL